MKTVSCLIFSLVRLHDCFVNAIILAGATPRAENSGTDIDTELINISPEEVSRDEMSSSSDSSSSNVEDQSNLKTSTVLTIQQSPSSADTIVSSDAVLYQQLVRRDKGVLHHLVDRIFRGDPLARAMVAVLSCDLAVPSQVSSMPASRFRMILRAKISKCIRHRQRLFEAGKIGKVISSITGSFKGDCNLDFLELEDGSICHDPVENHRHATNFFKIWFAALRVLSCFVQLG